MSKTPAQKKGDISEDTSNDSGFTFWPEWSEQEVLAEKWTSKHAFEDPDGTITLPRSIRKFIESYKRACDISGDANMVVVQANNTDEVFQTCTYCPPPNLFIKQDIKASKIHSYAENATMDYSRAPTAQTSDTPTPELIQIEQPKTPYGIESNRSDISREAMLEGLPSPDIETTLNGTSKLFQANRHLLCSDFYISILSTLHFIYENTRTSRQLGFAEDFNPWDMIYPKAKDGGPTYNPSGKYIVKLYWLGSWRKIVVDDRIPVDHSGRALVLTSSTQNEIWTMILSKALLKLACLSFSDELGECEFGDFDVLTALRGWIPESIKMNPGKGNIMASLLNDFWIGKRPVSRDLSSPSATLIPHQNKIQSSSLSHTLKPAQEFYFLFRDSDQDSNKIDLNTLSIPYRLIEVHEATDGSEIKSYLIRPYFSAGNKAGEFPEQWISQDQLCIAFKRLVVYHPPSMFKLSKSFNSVIDPSKVSDSIRPTNVLYLPEDHTPNTESGILAFISTFGKKSTLGNPTVLSVEEYNSKNAAIKEPVLRTSTNGFLGFHLIIKPGFNFENSTTYSITLYSKEEFLLEDEAKYLAEKHGFKVREFEDVLPAQQAGSWSILFKHIITITEPTLLLCSLYFPDINNYSTTIHAINNDNGEEYMPLVLNWSTQLFQPTKNGYTILVECRALQTRPASRWKFRLFSPTISVLLSDKEFLSTKSNVQDLSEVYAQNKHNILFRSLLKVKDVPMNLVSIQTQFSYSSIWIKLQLFDNDVEIFSTKGKGLAVIPSISLYLSDDPTPAKKDDKKGQAAPLVPITAKHKYVLQASIFPSEIEKLSTAATTTGDNRPTSRLKSSSSAGKKKIKSNYSVTPTGPAPLSIQPGDIEFSWQLRIISTDSSTISISKDTEKEDRYKSIKDSWEASNPGRFLRSKEIRDSYLKAAEVGLIRPLSISVNDKNVYAWSIIKSDCPKVTLQREKEDITMRKPSLLQRILTRPSTPATPTISEVKEEVPFALHGVCVGSSPSPIVLSTTDLEIRQQQRLKKIEAQIEIQQELLKLRQQEREKRAFAKKKIIDIVEEKFRELEFWERYDRECRDEYRQKLIAEAEESNLRLKAALDISSKTNENVGEIEEQGDKKKKAIKK